MIHIIKLITFIIIFNNCKKEERFETLGDKVSSPIDVAVNDDGNYFYVLNSDFDRNFNKGSLLVLDHEGQKKNVLELPRLGRNLTVAGNDMLITFDQSEEDTDYSLWLVDLSNPENPAVVKKFQLECDLPPFNTVMRKNYPYFAVSCIGGKLYVGNLAAAREESSIYLVRQYNETRRAMHIDPVRELLFAFSTDVGKQERKDEEIEDRRNYNDEGISLCPENQSCPNEVPDNKEDKKTKRKRKDIWEIHQFVVYNIGKERQVPTEQGGPFPFRKYSDSDNIVKNELRWLYFTLRNFDGTPDPSANASNPDYKYYRTNFWEAKPNPLDPNSFYLAHRGVPESSPHANSIVRLNIIGDIAKTSPAPLNTEDVLTFERIDGFKRPDDRQKNDYPGDFEIVALNGQQLLLVNHFKDLPFFKGSRYFAITAKTVDESFWFTEKYTQNPLRSYFQLAVSPQGRAITGSFYGNSLIMFDVEPGIGIKDDDPNDDIFGTLIQ